MTHSLARVDRQIPVADEPVAENAADGFRAAWSIGLRSYEGIKGREQVVMQSRDNLLPLASRRAPS